MDLRKFCFIIFSTLSVFLFCIGLFLLVQLNISVDASARGKLDSIIDPLRAGNEPVNILILGADKTSGSTDTMMVVNYNPLTAKISLISIPRDTKVTFNGGTHKINAAYSHGGPNLAMDTVGKLLNIKIKHYIVIKLSVFREVIDLLGGVDYYIPVDMVYSDPTQNLYINLKKGQQVLNGEKAEHFMRFRQPLHYNNEVMQFYDGGDLKRIDAQQSFIKEFVRQKANIKYLPRLNEIFKTVFANIDTDITLEQAVKMAQNAGKINADEINMFKLPGHSEDGGSWYYIPDMAGISEITSKHFSSRSGFTETKGVNKNSTPAVKQPEASEPKSTPQPVVEATPTPAADMTRNNPSNAETGFTDIGIEVP